MVAFWTKRSRHGWGKLLCFLAFLDAELTYYLATKLLPLTSKHQKNQNQLFFIIPWTESAECIITSWIMACVVLNWIEIIAVYTYESDLYRFFTSTYYGQGGMNKMQSKHSTDLSSHWTKKGNWYFLTCPFLQDAQTGWDFHFAIADTGNLSWQGCPPCWYLRSFACFFRVVVVGFGLPLPPRSRQ